MSHELICAWLQLPVKNWPPHHYALLGLRPGESDLQRIEEQVHQRMEQVRGYQLAHPEQATEAMNRLAQAYTCLTDPEAKKAYDAALMPRLKAHKTKPSAVPPRRGMPVPAPPVRSPAPDEPGFAWSDLDEEEDLEASDASRGRQSLLWVGLAAIALIGGLVATVLGIRHLTQTGTDAPATTQAPAEQVGRELEKFTGYREPVTCVAFTPDGRRILSASDEGMLRLWDLQNKQEVAQFAEHTKPVRSVAFSADGLRLLSGSEDGTMRLWDVKTGQPRHVFEGHPRPVTCVAIAPDGQHFLSGSEDFKVRLWSEDNEEHIQIFHHNGPVTGVAFFPNVRQAVSSAQDSTLRQWDIEAGNEVRKLVTNRKDFQNVAFSTDGRYAIATDNEKVRLYDVEAKRELRTFAGPTGPVTCVALSRDGQRALAGTGSGTLYVWDVATGRELCRCSGHTGPVTSVAFAPDGRKCLSAGKDRTMRLWEIK